VAEDGATECAAVFEELDGRSTAAVRVVASGAAIAGGGIARITAVVVIVAIKAMAEKIPLPKSVEFGNLARFGWLQRTTIQVARSTGDSVHHAIKTVTTAIVIVITRPQHSTTEFKKLAIDHVTIIAHSKDVEARKRCL
tara:strand:- start:576 stop:992 length:417 start_codon:yes stop_codon:yes gene_type:complete